MTLVRRSNGLFPSVPSFYDDFFTKDIYNLSKSNNLNGSSLPSVNIKEDDEGYVVEVAAPGLSKSDINVELENDILTISSEKESEANSDDYKRREFKYNSFKRTFSLPENIVNGEKVAAKYYNGVLSISLPKKEESKPKSARVIKVS